MISGLLWSGFLTTFLVMLWSAGPLFSPTIFFLGCSYLGRLGIGAFSIVFFSSLIVFFMTWSLAIDFFRNSAFSSVLAFLRLDLRSSSYFRAYIFLCLSFSRRFFFISRVIGFSGSTTWLSFELDDESKLLSSLLLSSLFASVLFLTVDYSSSTIARRIGCGAGGFWIIWSNLMWSVFGEAIFTSIYSWMLFYPSKLTASLFEVSGFLLTW